jgi:hypothetical protein
MVISRVKPANWAVFEKLTSAQMNAVDINTSYALDKRTGQTDTLLSDVTVGAGGQIHGTTGSWFVWEDTFILTGDTSIEGNATFDGYVLFDSNSEIYLDGLVQGRFRESIDCSLEMRTRTVDSATHHLHLGGQSPLATAVTNKTAGNIYLDVKGSLATESVSGSLYITDAGDNLFRFRRGANKLVTPTSPARMDVSYAGIGLSITTADNTSPGLSSGGITLAPGVGYLGAGSINLTAGSAAAAGFSAGSVNITAGAGPTTVGLGVCGHVTITGGAVTANSNTAGAINIVGGAGTVGDSAIGGSVNITSGASNNTAFAADVNVSGANTVLYSGTQSSAGKVVIKGGDTLAGTALGFAGNVWIYGGEAKGAGAQAGGVKLLGGNPTGSGALGGDVCISSQGGATTKGNICLNNETGGIYNGGHGVIWIANCGTVPTGFASALGVILFVEGGKLKCMTSSGTVQLAP